MPVFTQTLLEGVAPEAVRKSMLNADPCSKCPLATLKTRKPVKLRGVLPRDCVAIVIAAAPEAKDAELETPFAGPQGDALRVLCTEAGLDLERLGYVYLTRCRPAPIFAIKSDSLSGLNSESWKRAALACKPYFQGDINSPAHARKPLLLLGQHVTERLLDAQAAQVVKDHGVWHKSRDRKRMVMALRDPQVIVRSLNQAKKAKKDGAPEDKVDWLYANAAAIRKELVSDLRAFAARVNGTVELPPCQIVNFPDPGAAAEFLRWLARYPKPWAFDLETYDGAAFPSRKGVAVDPCHPDFRVRGVGIAVDGSHGVYIELKPWEDRKAQASELLSPAFDSSALKAAFNGHFDEQALMYPGWVRNVRNRDRDGMLAAIVLGDGEQRNTLERLVTRELDEPQYWDGADKSRIRELPQAQVAESCVRDATATLRLCDVLEERLSNADYFSEPVGW